MRGLKVEGIGLKGDRTLHYLKTPKCESRKFKFVENHRTVMEPQKTQYVLHKPLHALRKLETKRKFEKTNFKRSNDFITNFPVCQR